MRYLIGITFATIGLGLPAGAELRIDPAQCQPIYSVQKSQCVVEHIHRCDIDQGTFFRHIEIEPDDSDFVDIYTEDYDLISAYEVDGSPIMLGITDNRDPFSLAELLQTGQDFQNQTVEMLLPVFSEGSPTELRAATRLLDQAERISGVDLTRAASVPSLEVTGTAFRAEGREEIFIDRAAGIVIRGETTIIFGGHTRVETGNPVQILKPGDRFFMADIPLYGCGDETRLPGIRVVPS